MDTQYNYLITFVNHNSLLKVAVRFEKLTKTQEEKLKYWAEPESQEWIKENLPSYIADVGAIVEVETLFAIV